MFSLDLIRSSLNEQGRDCFICKQHGHRAKDCPERNKSSKICLRCGDLGHEMFTCRNDYCPEDLKVHSFGDTLLLLLLYCYFFFTDLMTPEWSAGNTMLCLWRIWSSLL